MTLNRRWLLKEYGQTDDGDVIYGLFDNETKSPYFLYSLNNYYVNKINDILNNYEKEIHELKQDCKNYTWYKQVKTLTDENEELKKQNKFLKKKLDFVIELLQSEVNNFEIGVKLQELVEKEDDDL